MTAGTPSPAGGTGPRAWSAAAHLALFASIIALPLLLLLGLLLYRAVDLERAELERRVEQVAADVVADLDRDLDRNLTILQTLTTSHSLATANFAGFYHGAKSSLEGKGYIVLIDTEGRQLVNTFVPYGEAPSLTGDPATLRAMLESRRPVVSDLFTSLVVKDNVYNVSAPVLIGGEIRYIVSLGLRPSDLQRLLTRKSLQADWKATIWDSKGVVLADSRGPQLVGTAVPPRLREGAPLGAYRTTSLDGVEVLHAFGRSSQSGWGVGVNVPLALIQAQVRESAWLWGLTILAAAGLVAALAVLFGRQLTQPLAAATAAARALGRGDAFAVEQSRVTEVNAVTDALETARRELEARSAALRRSEEQLRTAAEAAQFGAHEYDVAADRAIRSPQLRRILGADEAESRPTFESGLAFVHPDDREATRRKKQLILEAAQGSYQLEYRIRRPDGTVRWVMDRGQVLRDPQSGQAARVVGVLLDITELKEAEQRQKLLFDELNHRVKNTLAIIQSLARQTLRTRPDPEEFAGAFEDRLASLARAHTLLTRDSWVGANLRDIVQAAMAPFAGDDRTIRIGGDDITVPASATITLSLVIHELAVNAAKHGALSAPNGTLSIEWHAEQDAGGTRVDLLWREDGGPAVVPPTRQGFGSRLIAASARQLDGSFEMDFAPEGLRCRLHFRLPRPTPSVQAAAPGHQGG